MTTNRIHHTISRIHALSEDARRILAGVTLVVLGLGFLGVWSSFMSSRIVALGVPREEEVAPSSAGTSPAIARGPSTVGGSMVARSLPGPISPAAGIAGSVADAQKFFVPPATETQGFFAAIGSGLATIADAIYMKVARFVPPNL